MDDGLNGWSIPTSAADDPATRDREESAALLDLIAELAAEYHDDRPALLTRIRHAWVTLGPRVTAARMLGDYQSRYYEPMLGAADSM
jgi:starch phosphorylase